jgi:hypothetical protein
LAIADTSSPLKIPGSNWLLLATIGSSYQHWLLVLATGGCHWQLLTAPESLGNR